MSIFTDEYRLELFYLWYNTGKMSARNFYPAIPDGFGGIPEKPHKLTIQGWIRDEFKDKAEQLDLEIQRQIDANVVAEKVEMLRRHADVGKEMQEIAVTYLKDHKEELSPSSAIRLWVEGTRIERGSRGLPEALEKMLKSSDEDILAEIKELVSGSPIELLREEDNILDSDEDE